MSEGQQWVKSQRKRYQDTLRLNYPYYNGQQGSFKDLPTTIELLKQILALSQTAEGRAKIHKIDPHIMRYRFMDSLKIHWHRSGYWQFDNLALKIMGNLTTDPLFFKECFDMKADMIQLPKNSYGNIFRSLCAQVNSNIQMAEQKMKEDTKMVQYKQSFENKEEAIIELQKHDDILNFSCRSLHFNEEYPHYIGMLLGALKVGSRQQVIDRFPKSCFGCVAFSMIVTSNRCNRKDLALSFLQKLTDGWFTSTLFDCLLKNIKSLYGHLKYNTDLQDRGELVCLRMTQYERTKPVFQYLSKCNSKLTKGQLNQMKRVVNQSVLYYETEKIRYKDKLSQESSKIQSSYRQRSKKSKQYFQVSKILSADQITLMREKLAKRIQSLGYEIKQTKLRYCYEQSLHKYNLKNFLGHIPSQTVLVVKCKSGNILFAYFQTSSSYSKRTGHAYILEFSQLNTFEIGGLYDCMNLKKQKIHRNQKSSTQQKLQSHEQLEQQNRQEAFYASRKFREEEKYYSFGRRQFRDFEDQRKRSDNSQPFSSSDEEKQDYKNQQYSHKICFSFPRDEFKMSLKVKQGETTAKKSQMPNKQSQLIVKQVNLNEQPVKQSELTVKQVTLSEKQANWQQFFLKSCEGKMEGGEIRIQLQGLQIFDLDCKELK